VASGLRSRSTVERPVGAAPRWPAVVPWEVALILAAALCWLLLESRDAIVVEGGVAQVNGLLVSFPVLGIAGVALLVARSGTRLLPMLRRWAAHRRPPVYLAVNRLAAAPLAAGALLVAVTIPVAVLGYTATLAGSSETTLAAKVGVQVGAGRALISVDEVQRDRGTDAVGTVVDRYDGSVATRTGDGAARTDVQVIAVDPGTFARTAFWDESFADAPLDDLVAALDGPEVDGRIPVIATGLPRGAADLRLGTLPVAAQVAGTARVLPGRRTAEPVVLVAAARLPQIPAAAGSDRQSELWTNGPRGPAVDALTAAGGRLTRTVEPADVVTTANFLGIPWTFGYLSALAVFVGVIAVAGLLLHLEARGRAQVSAYVMGRRLGLSRSAHLRSLVVELTAVAVAALLLGALLAAGAVAVVHHRLDVDALRPPTPLLDLPWTAVALTAAGTLLVAALTARYAQRSGDRADPASVLRESA
jgi:putative ABC transport system permease protein